MLTKEEATALEELARTLERTSDRPELVRDSAEQLRNWIYGEVGTDELKQMTLATRKRAVS